MTKKKKDFDFEENIGVLEKLVESLESGELSLEESLATFEKGIKLTRECQQHLSEAEQRIQMLVGDNGETVDFESLEGE